MKQRIFKSLICLVATPIIMVLLAILFFGALLLPVFGFVFPDSVKIGDD